jgi:hypothetical protein
VLRDALAAATRRALDEGASPEGLIRYLDGRIAALRAELSPTEPPGRAERSGVGIEDVPANRDAVGH